MSMDIQKVLLQVIQDRDHEARVAAEYCAAGLWDLASERAKTYRALAEKVSAILEGRAKELYGIWPDREHDDRHIPDELAAKRLAE